MSRRDAFRLLACAPLVALLVLAPGCKQDDCASLDPQLELTLSSNVGFEDIDELRIEIALSGEASRVLSVKPSDLGQPGPREARMVIGFAETVSSPTTAAITIEARSSGKAVSASGLVNVDLQADGCNFATIALASGSGDAGADSSPGDAGPDSSQPDGPRPDGPKPDSGPPKLALGTDDADQVIIGESKDDRLGTLVVCDFNGDGLDDIVAAAPYADGPMGKPDRGRVYLLISSTTAARPAELKLNGGATTKIYGPSEGARLGTALACGDINADNVDDLIIGAPDGSGGGSVHVLFGSKSTLPPATLDLAGGKDLADVTVTGGETGYRLGATLAVAAFGGTPAKMLVIGAPGHGGQANDRPHAGAVFAIAGRTTWPSTFSLSTEPTVLFLGATADEWLGSVLAIGNLGGTAHDDLAIGAVDVDGDPAIRIFAGRDWGPPSTQINIDCGDTVKNRHLLLKAPSAVNLSLAAGDLNGDGQDDLLVGAPVASGSGEVYLLLGNELTVSEAAPFQSIDVGDSYQAVYGGSANSLLGTSIALIPSDGGGGVDLLLGAPGEDSDRGAVYRLSGRTGFKPAEEIDVGSSADLVLRVTGAAASDRLGSTVAGGQLDHSDNLGDALLAAPWSGNASEGRVYLVRGK